MLQLLVKLTQSMMAERLMFINELQATVLEVCPSLRSRSKSDGCIPPGRHKSVATCLCSPDHLQPGAWDFERAPGLWSHREQGCCRKRFPRERGCNGVPSFLDHR